MATRTRKKPADQKKKVGAKSTYKPDYLATIRIYASTGATDAEIAEALGVSDRQLRKWKCMHPEIVPALRAGKKEANERVKRALYSRAVGYTFDAEEVYVIAGKPVKVQVRKHVPPSDAAATFWLKNQERDEWRDMARVELSGPNEGPIAMVNAPLPADPIEAMAVYLKIMSGGE